LVVATGSDITAIVNALSGGRRPIDRVAGLDGASACQFA
jgi:hypothetical protein